MTGLGPAAALSRPFAELAGPALAGGWHPEKLNILNGVQTSMVRSSLAELRKTGTPGTTPRQAVPDI